MITFAVRSLTKGGWIGFGFSNGGSKPMIGSNVVVGWSYGTNTFVILFIFFYFCFVFVLFLKLKLKNIKKN